MFVINAMYAVFMFNRAVQHEGNILQTSFFFFLKDHKTCAIVGLWPYTVVLFQGNVSLHRCGRAAAEPGNISFYDNPKRPYLGSF